MNENGEDERPKVAWGTAGLVSGFTGIIRDARIQRSEKTFFDERTGEEKEARHQLVLTIEPLYEDRKVPEDRWIKSYYSLSSSRRSKWGKLQEALEKCGALPKDSEEELVGMEFEWERVDLEFGKRADGTKIVVEGAILPKRFIRDHKKGKGKETPKEAVKEPSEDVDVEALIVEAASKEPVKVEQVLDYISKTHKLRRTDVYRKVMELRKRGVIKVSDDGTLTVME